MTSAVTDHQVQAQNLDKAIYGLRQGYVCSWHGIHTFTCLTSKLKPVQGERIVNRTMSALQKNDRPTAVQSMSIQCSASLSLRVHDRNGVQLMLHCGPLIIGSAIYVGKCVVSAVNSRCLQHQKLLASMHSARPNDLFLSRIWTLWITLGQP